MEATELKLNYPQSKYKLSQNHFTCIKGTWGCGKSRIALMTANDECEKYPNNLYLVIRKEWVDLRDSTLHDWNNWIGYPISGEKNVEYPNGSILMFRHGEDLNALKNINLGGCLMVQGEEMTEDDFWFLNGRLRRQEGTRQLRIECNYDGHNWIYKLFNEQKVGTLFTTNTFDNQENLPPDYIPNLQKLPKKLQERYLYGSDADMEGLIWDEFSMGRNVIDPFLIPADWKKTIVLDHGFTNPTAVAWYATDWDGNIYLYDEHYEGGHPISYHAECVKLRDNSNVHRWLIDPSCGARTQQKRYADGRVDLRSIIDEYAEYGLHFEPADNNQMAGINRANEYFKTGRLRIVRSCVNAVEEVSNWKWQKLKPGVYKNTPDEPQDYKNHLCDTIIYLMNSRPQLPEKSEEPINLMSAWGRYRLTQQSAKEPIYSR